MMDFTIIISLLALINGLSLIAHSIIGKTQTALIKDFLIKVYLQLEDSNLKTIIKSSSAQIVTLFNYIFGIEHLTWKCFSRSIISSLIGLAITLTIFYCFTDYSVVIKSDVPNYIIWIVLTIFFNLIVDYISLVETRFVLKYASSKNLLIIFIFVIGDFIFSISLFLVIAIAAYGYLLLFSGENLDGYIEFLKAYFDKNIFTPIFNVHSLSPFIYSSLFTSILFYLFTITNIFLKFILLLRISIKKFINWFDGLDKPFLIMGYLFSGFVLVFKAIELIIK